MHKTITLLYLLHQSNPVTPLPTTATCCPVPSNLPRLPPGASWDASTLYTFPNTQHSCEISDLDDQSGCTSYAASYNASHTYCSADVLTFNVPSGFLRGCCSKIKGIELNNQPLSGSNGKPPSPFTTCQDGTDCQMGTNCNTQACNVLSSGSYNTSSTIGVNAVDVLDAWLSLRQLKQQQSWMTFYGAGFEASKSCPTPSHSFATPIPPTPPTTAAPLPLASIACSRLVLSSFPTSNCPQCGTHGNCLCLGSGVSNHPVDFSLACQCDTDDDWYGPTCSIHCERDHGIWNAHAAKCVCHPHYYTEDCSLHCVHGTFNTKSMHCDCQEGWEGDACTAVKKCHPKNIHKSILQDNLESDNPDNGCNGHGTCIDSTCKCDASYTGVFCKLHCPNCQHEGYCDRNITHAKNGQCVCAVGWKGNFCETSRCDTNPDISNKPCSGRGQCLKVQTSTRTTVECVCTAKYKGTVCDECYHPNMKAPWCTACKPGYASSSSNCTQCDNTAGFVPDPAHRGLCVLSAPPGLGGTKLTIVIGVAFVLGVLVFCLVRKILDQKEDGPGGNGGNGGGHFNDPAMGYVKLNSAMGGRQSLLQSSSGGSSNKPREPWDDDFLFDIKRLRLGKKIGSGTSGEVFVATWDDATRVAAKRLYAPSMGASAFDRAFRREVSLLSQLHHPNIVQLLGVCEDPESNGTCFIVTELCMGSLREVIDDETFDLSPALSLRMALQISSGMLYLHEKDVIHRDLKPGNVLVSPADSNRHIQVKLCDFGLSRVKSSLATLTAMTAAVGTPAYMAPELVQGNQMIDSVDAGKAVDVFSFAMLMLEIFTRERPYVTMTFNNSYHLMMRVCDGLRPDIPDGSTASGSDVVPKPVAALCRRCWDSKPTERPSFEQIVLTLKLLEREEERESRVSSSGGGGEGGGEGGRIDE